MELNFRTSRVRAWKILILRNFAFKLLSISVHLYSHKGTEIATFYYDRLKPRKG